MTSYPLAWPSGWKRTELYRRKEGRFRNQKNWITTAVAADRVLDSLSKMGIADVIISTNVEPTLSGRPRSGLAEPSDPGVAVYWKAKSWATHRVMAIDQYKSVADNLAAIAATLEAMRAIERHGGAVILERAFTGFTSLPSPNDWRHVMGFDTTPTLEQAKERYKQLSLQRHPDTGGSDAAMAELNWAWECAERELS